ncbi:MAG TPA: type II toxin-antitoxin system VapC family toxin [Candidatus Binatia bacterium]|nr:type II toxin-antitoxin system VapC family toxin [Candidatus Binatia bacterium]
MIYFLDTSALAKRYLTEKGSLRVRRLLQAKADVFYQTFLTPVELASALYRRLRERDITVEELAVMLRAYVTHSHQDYLLVPYSDTLMERAAMLLAHHALRALDAVQLASALDLRDRLPANELPLAFLSSDERLVEAARQEHLRVRNPERWR